jgi:hypothetical protein
MFSLNHNTDSLGRKVLLQPVRHLDRQPFLHLEVAGEQLDNARQLGQAKNAFTGQLADVSDPGERQHVVLTQGMHRDVLGQDQLVVFLVVGERREVELTWREHLGERLGNPAGSIGQVRGGGITTKSQEQGANCLLGGRLVYPLPAMHDPQSPTLIQSAFRRHNLMLELGNAHA